MLYVTPNYEEIAHSITDVMFFCKDFAPNLPHREQHFLDLLRAGWKILDFHTKGSSSNSNYVTAILVKSDLLPEFDDFKIEMHAVKGFFDTPFEEELTHPSIHVSEYGPFCHNKFKQGWVILSDLNDILHPDKNVIAWGKLRTTSGGVRTPHVEVHPRDQIVTQSEKLILDVVSKDSSQYQWQIRHKHQSKWENLSNDDIRLDNTANSTTLVFNNVNLSMNDSKLRCILGNTYGHTISEEVTIKVEPCEIHEDYDYLMFVEERNNAFGFDVLEGFGNVRAKNRNTHKAVELTTRDGVVYLSANGISDPSGSKARSYLVKIEGYPLWVTLKWSQNDQAFVSHSETLGRLIRENVLKHVGLNLLYMEDNEIANFPDVE